MYLVAAFVVLFCVVRNSEGSALVAPAVPVQGEFYGEPGLDGRPLVIKTIPGVERYQSDVYEVYMEPYNYDFPPPSAIAVIGMKESKVKGEIFFTQRHPPAGPVSISGNITGLPPGKHGLHIHQSGDLRYNCDKLGNHFNPFLHGGPTDNLRHVGDLGNVEADGDGTAKFNLVDPLISLVGGHRGVVGRAIVITTDADDLGRAGTADSIEKGSSGRALACGVIAYTR